MNHTASTALFCTTLLAGMVLLIALGRSIGVRQVARGEPPGDLSLIDGAVFGLVSLVVAFTFSAAASRFDARRMLIVEETNAIGTAYLRVDLLPPLAQPAVRDAFRRYIDMRLGAYAKLPDVAAAYGEVARAKEIQQEIWTLAITALRGSESSPATILTVQALNGMIDLSTTQLMSTRLHPPPAIFVTLAVLALAAAFIAGHATASKQLSGLLHLTIFAVLFAATVFLILDLEYPFLGMLRIDDFLQPLRELRQQMG